MATQAERIVELEKQVAELTAALAAFPQMLADALKPQLSAALAPLGQEIVAAHRRIDDAARVFSELRKAVTPRNEPPAPTTHRIPRRDFDRALEDLRAEAQEQGSDRTFFPTQDILRRAATLAAMEANTQAAA